MPGRALTIDEPARRRYPPRVESAVYFCCVEAVRAGAGPVSVDLSGVGGGLVLRIVGAHDEVDLQAVVDRVEAVGGELSTGAGQQVLVIPPAADPRAPDRAPPGPPARDGAESVVADGAIGAVPGG